MFFDNYSEFVTDDPRINRKDGYLPTKEFLSSRYENMLPIDLVKDRTILDIGSCVSSLGAWALASGAKHYTGVEIQKELTIIAERNLVRYFNSARWKVITEDVEQWINSLGQYDIIVVAGTLHTFVDHIAVLKKLASCTDCLIVESTHPHIYSEMLTNMYDREIFNGYDKTVIHTLLESSLFKDTVRKILEEKLPVVYNRNSRSVFKSQNGQATSVEVNATYPSIGFLNNIMNNLGFATDLSINQNLKAALPDSYNWPGRFAVMYQRSDTYKILKFQDYDHS